MSGCLFKINRSVELTVKYRNWIVGLHKKIKTIENFSCESLPASFEVSGDSLKSCDGELVVRLCLKYWWALWRWNNIYGLCDKTDSNDICVA